MSIDELAPGPALAGRPEIGAAIGITMHARRTEAG